MTEATNTKLMDTEAGGEQTQYEGIHTFVEPSKKSSGQLGSADEKTKVADGAQTDSDRQERGEKTTENIRYGQNMSENGMGGMTKGMEGSGQQAGDGIEDEEGNDARVAQGYGDGSGVGA